MPSSLTVGGKWQEVGPKVFRRRYPSFDVNVGVVLADEEALVVDTRASAVEGRELLADLRALTALPCCQVVNTHFHFDHCFGNEVFLPATIWGHRRCAERLRQEGRAEQAAVVAWLTNRAEEMASVTITPPDHVVENHATLTVGGRQVELWHPGRGHTDHDLVVVVPDAGVVFAGDLLEGGMPPSFGDAWPLEWPDTLRRVLDHAPDVVVPGHGDVVRRADGYDRVEELARVADLLGQVGRGECDVTSMVSRAPFPEEHIRVALHRFIRTSQPEGGEGTAGGAA